MELGAELYSKNSIIPEKFRLYHGGKSINRVLKRDLSVTRYLSGHVFFSTDLSYVQEEYLGDMCQFQDQEKNLYLIDARDISGNSFIITNLNGVWYDEIRRIEEIIQGFRQNKINDLSDLVKLDPNFLHNRVVEKCPKLKTKEDFLIKLKEAKYNWFPKYTRPFNIMHMQRYKKLKRKIIGVPGPIPVIN